MSLQASHGSGVEDVPSRTGRPKHATKRYVLWGLHLRDMYICTPQIMCVLAPKRSVRLSDKDAIVHMQVLVIVD